MSKVRHRLDIFEESSKNHQRMMERVAGDEMGETDGSVM